MARDLFQSFGGRWTERKLQVLTEYLRQYNKALKNQKFERVYIDAFAGTGYRQQAHNPMAKFDVFRELEAQDAQRFMKGSTVRALEVSPPFHRYVFIESDPRKVKELEDLRLRYPRKAEAVEIVGADANAYIQDYCDAMPPYARAVVFLDPFATQVEWKTVMAIANTKAIDVWILFPLMAVNRLLARDAEKACRPALDSIFGTREWFEAFYRTSVQNDIFGQPLQRVKKACDTASIGDFYRARLDEAFAGVAQPPCIFRNSRNSPLFQLFFAAGNPKGAPIAVRIAEHLLENL